MLVREVEPGTTKPNAVHRSDSSLPVADSDAFPTSSVTIEVITTVSRDEQYGLSAKGALVILSESTVSRDVEGTHSDWNCLVMEVLEEEEAR